MQRSESIKRLILFIIGLFIMSFGVAMTKFANLGVSPISSVANILSLRIESISLGNFLILWNILLILGQILILRSDFDKKQLIQLPISFLFGYFTDICLKFLTNFKIDSYTKALIYLFIGVFFLALGVSITVIADIFLNSGEAFVKAISDKFNKNFGRVKVIFDISCVVISVILSLLFFKNILGTREGTLIAAVLTGFLVNIIVGKIKNPLEKFLNLA